MNTNLARLQQGTRIPEMPTKKRGKPKKQSRIGNRIIILDNLDFDWKENDIKRVIQKWREGASIEEMAAELRPSVNRLKKTAEDGQDEVILLLFHLSRQGKISPREGGIFGA